MKPKLISDRKRSLEQKPQCINEITIQRDGKKNTFYEDKNFEACWLQKKIYVQDWW